MSISRHIKRKIIDHLWGPIGSIILHVLIIYALVHFVVFDARDVQPDIEVTIMEMETVDIEELLDELEPELDPLEHPDEPIDAPDMDVDMDQSEDRDFVQEDPDVDFDALNIMDAESPLIMRGLLAGRTAEGRTRALETFGGTEETEAAAIRALEWLKRNQLEDGSWEGEGGHRRARTAWTGLALLTFLAHGETPSSERYGPVVERALRFLIETAQNEDGSFNHVEGVRGGVYSHGITSYALAEAAALTRIPDVIESAQKAVSHIVQGQRRDGGFDYHFAKDGGQRDRCTSVAAWMAQAMKAASLAQVDVPGLENAMEQAVNGFKLNFDQASGHFIYSSESGGIRHSMTPTAVLSLQLLGHGDSVEARSGLGSISGWSPDWDDPDTDGRILEPLYVWYYATQAFFHEGGADWQRWNREFASMLVRNQNDDGSWTWRHGRAADYGQVYATTFSALSLMVYYRYLPTFAIVDDEEEKDDDDEDEVIIEII